LYPDGWFAYGTTVWKVTFLKPFYFALEFFWDGTTAGYAYVFLLRNMDGFLTTYLWIYSARWCGYVGLQQDMHMFFTKILRDMDVCLLAIYEYILPGDVDMWLFIKSPHKRVLVSEICLLGVKSSTMQFLTLS
jgi:hypothetical protein